MIGRPSCMTMMSMSFSEFVCCGLAGGCGVPGGTYMGVCNEGSDTVRILRVAATAAAACLPPVPSMRTLSVL